MAMRVGDPRQRGAVFGKEGPAAWGPRAEAEGAGGAPTSAPLPAPESASELGELFAELVGDLDLPAAPVGDLDLPAEVSDLGAGLDGDWLDLGSGQQAAAAAAGPTTAWAPPTMAPPPVAWAPPTMAGAGHNWGAEPERPAAERLFGLQTKADLLQHQLDSAARQLGRAFGAIEDLQGMMVSLKRQRYEVLDAHRLHQRPQPSLFDMRMNGNAQEKLQLLRAMASNLPTTSDQAAAAAAAAGGGLGRGAGPERHSSLPVLAVSAHRPLPPERQPKYSDADLLRCLSMASKEKGAKTVSSREYQTLARSRKLDSKRKWPTYETIVRRFGGWGRAFKMARRQAEADEAAAMEAGLASPLASPPPTPTGTAAPSGAPSFLCS